MTGITNHVPENDWIAFQDSENILNHLIQHAHFVHIVLDSELRIKVWNSAAEVLWGVAEQDALGCFLSDLLTDEMSGLDLQGRLDDFLDNPRMILDSSISMIEDKELFCEWQFFPTFGQEHQLTGITIIVQDISKWVIIENELNELKQYKFKNMFEKAPIGIYQAAVDGAFLHVNPVLAWMLGYESIDELKAKHEGLSQGVFVDGKKCREFFFHLQEAEQVSHFRARILRKDGTQFWGLFHAQITLNQAGRPDGFYGFITDINTTVRAEIELQKAMELAESATRAKSDFLANMSHEIRTPLNAIIGFTDLVLKTDLTEKQKDYIRKVSISGRTLLGIINDILDFSKIEAGKMELESKEFYLYDVLNNLSDMFANIVMSKGIDLILSSSQGVPQALKGDFFHLTQILINLINNSIKFTEKGEVVVWVSLVEKGDGQVKIQFSISDTGIGMTEEQRLKLFSSFTQADTSTIRKYGGTGLGLSISKRLVELMGGEIWVKSEKDKGSTFGFTVVLDLQPAMGNLIVTVPPEMTELRILVQDSSPATREVIMTILMGYGFSVMAVESGDDTLGELDRGMLNDKPYDLVFINWQGAAQNAVLTTKSIRLWEENHRAYLENHRKKMASKMRVDRMPLIMTMDFGQEENRQRALSAGATAFVVKPIKQTDLLNVIMNVFGYPPLYVMDIEDKTNQDVKDRIKGLWVLVVDDNEINQEVAKENLNRQGVYVEVASSGKMALAMISQKGVMQNKSGGILCPYDVILMDIQMPDMDGYQTAREIRSLEKTWTDSTGQDCVMPVIAMSAHAFSTEMDQCYDAGMNDYVSKPIEPSVMFSKIALWAKPKPGRPLMNVYDHDDSTDIHSGINHAMDGIDMVLGLTRVDGNRPLFEKLLHTFYQKNRSVDQDIRTALANDGHDEVKRLAHLIKGVAGNLGMMGLFTSAGLLEDAAKKKDTVLLDEVFNTFSDHLKEVLSSLERLHGQPDTTESLEHDDVAPPDLHELISQVEQFIMDIDDDIAQVPDKVVGFKKALMGTPFINSVNAVETFLGEFDGDGAKNELMNLVMAMKKSLDSEIVEVPSEKTQKVLIVDDVSENIEVLMALLKSDYKVIAAKNGEKALALASSKQQPDLILLDINMPGMDGFEVCRRLKENEKTRDIPVIFITAESEIGDQTKGFELGAMDYITKPIVPIIVKMRVKTQLEIKRHRDALSILSTMDGLTGISNRRRFDDILQREWHRCMRSNSCLSLVLMDIDHFKFFNDHYGHQAGDLCLQKVAKALEKGCMRETDLVARYGGEEFVTILPDTDLDGAIIVADRMRQNISGLMIPHAHSSAADYVTISQGLVTMVPHKDVSIHTFIEQSDQCLYQAKETGRNRLVSRLIGDLPVE